MKVGANDISKLYVGATEVSKMYLGSSLVHGEESLPYDAEVEYLQSSGTQYIDLGIKPKDNEVIEIMFQYTSTESKIVLGCRTSSSSGKYVIGSGSGGTQIYGALGSATNPTLTAFDTQEHFVTMDTGTGKASIDSGGEISIGTFSANGLNIYLFACNQNGTLAYQASARVFSLKIGDRIDMIPVRVGSVGYMYDKVTGTLFGNLGSSAFTYGADV